MRIAFFGSGAFGLPTIRALHQTCDLVGVVTQPDRPAGRGRTLTPTPIAAWAAEHTASVPLLKPDRVNQPDVMAEIDRFDADAWVVIAFGQKLSETLLAGRFAINLHASLLPRWRGAAPINWAIIAGDSHTGNSVITLADRMDAGLVLATSPPRPIEPDLTTDRLHDQLADDGPAAVLGVLEQSIRGSLTPAAQDDSLVTHARKLSRDDAWIDLCGAADTARARINGLSPWPGVSATLDGKPLKLMQATSSIPDTDTDAAPGTLIDPEAGDVRCGDGAFRLLRVQPAGKPAMAWSDFARGRSLDAGAMLDSNNPTEPVP